MRLARLRRFAGKHLECVNPELHTLARGGRVNASTRSVSATSREAPHASALTNKSAESHSVRSHHPSDNGDDTGSGPSMQQMEAQWQSAFSTSIADTDALESAGSPVSVESSGPPVLWEPPVEPEPNTSKPKPTKKPLKSKKSQSSAGPASATASRPQGGVLVGVEILRHIKSFPRDLPDRILGVGKRLPEVVR